MLIGEYEVASCIGGRKAAGGLYDWEKAAKTKFASGGGLTVLETTGAKRIECTVFSGEGEYYRPFPQDETISVRLFGCKEPTLKVECHNSAPEEIDLVMFGEYGFIKNPASVGMSLKLSDPQKFECGPNKNQYRLEGGAIGSVTPIDKMSKATFKFKFKPSPLLDRARDREQQPTPHAPRLPSVEPSPDPGPCLLPWRESSTWKPV